MTEGVIDICIYWLLVFWFV